MHYMMFLGQWFILHILPEFTNLNYCPSFTMIMTNSGPLLYGESRHQLHHLLDLFCFPRINARNAKSPTQLFKHCSVKQGRHQQSISNLSPFLGSILSFTFKFSLKVIQTAWSISRWQKVVVSATTTIEPENGTGTPASSLSFSF